MARPTRKAKLGVHRSAPPGLSASVATPAGLDFLRDSTKSAQLNSGRWITAKSVGRTVLVRELIIELSAVEFGLERLWIHGTWKRDGAEPEIQLMLRAKSTDGENSYVARLCWTNCHPGSLHWHLPTVFGAKASNGPSARRIPATTGKTRVTRDSMFSVFCQDLKIVDIQEGLKL
jgi:hypothetical protein